MSATIAELTESLFEDPSFDEKVLRFATDPGCQVVYLTRDRQSDLDPEGMTGTDEPMRIC